MAFEFDGKKYSQVSGHQKAWGYRLISELGLSGSERVLDLGCGDGVLTYALAQSVPTGEVIGLDSSQSMMAAASQHKAPNLSFILCDINHLDFAAEFDIIFSNAALHWVKDHARLLANSRQALKPGGRLLWNFAGDGNCAGFFAVVREHIQKPEFRPFFIGFEWPWFMPKLAEYRRLIADAGYQSFELLEINADRHFKDADEITGWVDQPSIIPFLAKINDAEAKHLFRDSVVRDLLHKSQCADGTFFETFRRIQVSAQTYKPA